MMAVYSGAMYRDLADVINSVGEKCERVMYKTHEICSYKKGRMCLQTLMEGGY
jgi:hypothetical protein